MDIRRLTADDAALACRALLDIKLTAPALPSSVDVSALARWLAHDDHVLVVASETGRPLGFALGYFLARVDGEDRMLFFYEIEVVERERRRGIGRLLVEEMKDIAERSGVRKLWVETDIDNAPARSLYAAAGGRFTAGFSIAFVWFRDDLGHEVEGKASER